MPNAKLVGSLAAVCFLGMSSAAFADSATITEKIASLKTASQELQGLYEKSKAVEDQIEAAAKKQQAAEEALRIALQAMDPKNPDLKLMEKAYAEIEAARQSITAAEVEAHNSEAIATERAAVQQ
jgi:biopolymer transport protein ExbB/TolQ